MVARPPMVALLAKWLRSLTMVASVNLATAKKRLVRPPMVALLAIWLHLLSTLSKKHGCATSYGSAPGNMVASINLATAKKMVAQPPMVARPPMVALKMDEIQTIN